jgi:uncharacterized membrane protein
MSDWGLFHQRLQPLVNWLVFVSLLGAFISGFLVAFGNIYFNIFAFILLGVSLASVGYDAALGQIHVFARNSYEKSDLSSSALISESAPTEFSHKYDYQARPALAAAKLYFSILISCFWGFVFIGISCLLGVMLGFFVVSKF